MARFAFVVPPLVGHVNPTVSLAAALAARGHAVAWIGHEAIRPLLPAGAELRVLDDGQAHAAALARSRRARGLESLQVLWQDLLVPLARAMRPGVEAALDALLPDVLVVDQQAIAGALAARRAGLPWASLATTSAGITDPLAGLPRVKAWVAAQLAVLQEEAGLPALAEGELSPRLVVVFSTEALIGPLDRFPRHYRFVGPPGDPTRARPEATPFPFEALAPDKQRVLVSLGTVSSDRGDGFYETVVAAFADDPAIQVILVAPAGTSAPPGMIVRPRVPQLALLPHLHAVVSHGGHNTVCEALAHGLPLVVTPIRDDQPVIARQVADAGCGLRLRYGRLPAPALRDAVHTVLEDPRFREAAARVRASFERAGGAPRAAAFLEELAP